MRTVRKHLEEKLKDASFKEHYELDEVKLQFVKPIIAYRIKRNITQGELGDMVGVTQQQISKIENGDFHNFDTLVRVLAAIGKEIKRIEIGNVSSKKSANSAKLACH